MFWKKKNSEPLLVVPDSDERRRDVRIKPHKTLYLTVDNQSFPVVDISSSGLSFQKSDLTSAQSLKIAIKLPELSAPHLESGGVIIYCTINVLRCTEALCHCQFKQIPAKAQKQLDHFILTEQKLQIREHKLQ